MNPDITNEVGRHMAIGEVRKMNLPHSAVPYSFQCERVLAVIATELFKIFRLIEVTGSLE